MKTTYSSLLRLLPCAVLLAFASCSNFLDEEPKDQNPPEEAFSDASSLYLNAVATLYNYFGGYQTGQGLQGTYHGVYDLQTFTSDEAIIPTRGGDWYDGGFWQELYTHNWSTVNDAVKQAWVYLYKVITLSNTSLERIETHADLLTAEQKTAYTAEVRAIRAMYYTYLLDLYGRIPLVLSTETPMSEVQQSERSEVFRYVVSELQDVAEDLSAERSNNQGDYYGRITRPVVYFLLAKLALNAEVWTDDDWTDGQRTSGKDISFVVDGTTMNAWEACTAYCEKITALGYTLDDDFATPFGVYNETSKENILTIPMDPASYTNQNQNLFRSYHYGHASAYGFTAENGSCATLDALDVFGYGTEAVDARFAQTYYADTVRNLSGDVITLQDGDTLIYFPRDVLLNLTGQPHEATAGARMHKYAVDKTATKDGKLMNNDIVLFRYADVLLMESEAKVRNGQNGDYELNLVRRRSGMSERTATLSNLLAERQLELAWEAWRRQDLIRFDRFTRAYSSRPQLPNEATGYTTVFPIPSDVLALNRLLKQNPGY